MSIGFGNGTIQYNGVDVASVGASGFTSGVGVTSVNGSAGAISAAQIASAATSGYGYTPANGASYVAKDAATAIGASGCFIYSDGSLGLPALNGTYAANSGRLWIAGFGTTLIFPGTGTWRVTHVGTMNYEYGFCFCTAQRIA